MDLKMSDERSSNYNSCNDVQCKVTRQSLCHCVILWPLGSYWKKSLLVENKSQVPICVKVDGDIDWIEPKASAAGEVLFGLIKPLGVELTKNIAINLYTAILTDTGGFKFENTKPKTSDYHPI